MSKWKELFEQYLSSQCAMTCCTNGISTVEMFIVLNLSGKQEMLSVHQQYLKTEANPKN